MTTTRISEQIIDDINEGKESAFSALYDCYYSYLCAYATTYVFDPDEAKEIVNDVFMNIWSSRGQLSFPIHNYLLRSVQNRCLNYIRTLHTRERVLDEYREELIAFQEEFCKNDNNPLQLLEIEELKRLLSLLTDEDQSSLGTDEKLALLEQKFTELQKNEGRGCKSSLPMSLSVFPALLLFRKKKRP